MTEELEMKSSRSQPLAAQTSLATSDVEPAAAFTPGPWDITAADGPDLYVTAEDGGDTPWNIAIAIGACGYPDDPRTGSTLANARLISAAPDLLRECQEAQDYLSASHQNLTNGDWDDYGVMMLFESLRAAINKALGGAS